jgi:hypothetical protein
MTKQQERHQLWRERITAFRSSGQSVREWCTGNGIRPQQMWYWLRRLETKHPEGDSPTWLQAVVNVGAVSQDTGGLIVRVGKAAIEVRPGFHPELLSQVVRTLSFIC